MEVLCLKRASGNPIKGGSLVAMKTKDFEHLLGGTQASNLSRDAMISLHGIGRSLSERSAEDELFATAIRKANDEQLRKLARFRIDSSASKHLD